MAGLSREVLGAGAGLVLSFGATEAAQANANQAFPPYNPGAHIAEIAVPSALHTKKALAPSAVGRPEQFASLNNPNNSVMRKIIDSCVLQAAGSFEVQYGMPTSLRKMTVSSTSETIMSGDPDGEGPGQSVDCKNVISVDNEFRPLIEGGKGKMVTNGPEFSENHVPSGIEATVEDGEPDGSRTVTFEGVPLKRAYTCEGTRKDSRVRHIGVRIKTTVRNLATKAIEKVSVTRLESSNRTNGKQNGC